jgi:hypothetical protein
MGTGILSKSVEEISNGFEATPLKRFYEEAMVDVDNVPSNKIAAEVLSTAPTEIKDVFSGAPALHYCVWSNRNAPSAKYRGTLLPRGVDYEVPEVGGRAIPQTRRLRNQILVTQSYRCIRGVHGSPPSALVRTTNIAILPLTEA